ncbi:PPE family protein [Mycobacterium sp. Z3061]|uniref:PPE family protein n=1 Tax=Mycobacterium sp. Z3061 TaxID=3073562 RepID=UPI0037CB89DF
MSFAMLAPEITSAQMYSGAGSGPMLGAAAAWAGLGDELGSAAASFGSVTANLASGAWQGPASVAMTAVAARYRDFLNGAAVRAVTAATQAKSVAAIFEAAKAAVAHPVAVRANRLQFVSAIRSNFLGLNGPLIAAIEGAYDELWAQNVSALVGYHGAASAAAAQIAPWQEALGDIGARVGRVVETNGSMVSARVAANDAEVAGAARFTRGALDAAAVEARFGRPGAWWHVGSAVAYDAQTAGRLLAENAALPGQIFMKDIDILAAPGSRPPATAPVALPAAAGDLGAALRADAVSIDRVLADNQTQLLRAEAVTESSLRAAQAAVMAGDPVAAARDVASAVAYDADTVARLGVEDLSLPGELIREDIAILAGRPAPAAALPAGPSNALHQATVEDLVGLPQRVYQADAAAIGHAVADTQAELVKAAAVTQNGFGTATLDLMAGEPVRAVNDVSSALAYDAAAAARVAAREAALVAELAATDAAIIGGTFG